MSNLSTFNAARYLELLKIEETFDYELTKFRLEHSEEYNELVSFNITLENQLFYNEKNEFMRLIKKFLAVNNDISGSVDDFIGDFMDLRNKQMDLYRKLRDETLEKGIKKLENFQIDSRSDKFMTLIDDISDSCQAISDPEFFHLSVEEFTDEIKTAFLKFQKCSEE